MPTSSMNITLSFSGLLILCASGGEPFQVLIPEAEFAPEHSLTFNIKKKKGGDETDVTPFTPDDIPDDLSLVIDPAPRGGAELLDNFNQFVVDLEGRIYGHKLEVITDNLRSIFTINGGEYGVSEISEKKLKFVDRKNGGGEKPLGKVALTIKGSINLDEDQTATLMAGEEELLTFEQEPDTQYEIVVRLDHTRGHQHHDFNPYEYLMEVFDLSQERSLFLPDEVADNSHPQLKTSPDARCTTPNLGQTAGAGGIG